MNSPSTNKESSSSSSIHRALSRLLVDEKYADLTIRCGQRNFRAHRAILCPQSEFFDKACRSGFKESLTQVIDFPEDDPYVLSRFLRFIYTGNYKDDEYLAFSAIATDSSPEEKGQGQNGESGTESNTSTSLFAHLSQKTVQDSKGHSQQTEPDRPDNLFLSLRVYVMADKFVVPDLKLLASDRFFEAANDAYDTWEHFPTVVDEMCKTTAPTDVLLRQRTCQLIATKTVKQRKIPTSLELVMRNHADLAVDVLRYSQAVPFSPPSSCVKCRKKSGLKRNRPTAMVTLVSDEANI